MRIDPKEISTPDLHAQLLGCIGPRPIAWASTVDEQGKSNLAPYSFFNVFSTNPPTLILSPAKPRDLQLKHTLLNAMATKEIVINIVSFDVVEQMSLSSTAYAKGVNEFVKAGVTAVDSEKVKPPRVGESIAAFECKVKEVVHLGDDAGAGNLIICEIVLAHIKDEVLGDDGKPDPYKTDLVGRMGGDWYCRANGEAIFKLPKPNRNLGIGVDQIPAAIRNSTVLTGNNLGRLGNIEKIPENDRIFAFSETSEIREIKTRFINDKESLEYHLHELAQRYLVDDDLESAWLTLLQTID
ncbi:flavin reductase family protein [Roseivirga sp. E12]|uniref:flavin reductase family protein n=1 Tax=Roseivirga sp. E12 TaxID=2819237 RepID=UPI001ABC33A8|nr:flavin reductase family protein [Roseivirga sp. E12]MBO3698672.1 flavin reductase family protein [Roseivirga sp. E12]